MNIRLALYIALFLVSNCCLAQVQAKTQQNMPIQNAFTEKKEFVDSVGQLRNELNKIQFKIDSMAKANKNLRYAHDTLSSYVNDTRLRESLRSAESTINKQNSWMTGFGTIYNTLTIVIGLLTFVLPIVFYMLGVRPARKALKKAQKGFEDHLNEYRSDQINEAIENLRSGSNDLITNSTNFILSHIPSGNFTETQLYRIYTIAKFENIPTLTKTNLSFILSIYNYPFCKDYFLEIIKKKIVFDASDSINYNLKNYAFNYLMKFHKKDNDTLNQLEILSLSWNPSSKGLITLLGWCTPDNTEILWQILNYKSLMDQFDSNYLREIYQAFKGRTDIVSASQKFDSESAMISDLNAKLGNTYAMKRLTSLDSSEETTLA